MAEPTTRKECIKNNQVCKSLFYISGNSKASGEAPWYESETIGLKAVLTNHKTIESVATEKGVSARLIRAIMFMEESHGYYDAPLNPIGVNKSIRPMNINVDYWGDTFGTRADMQDAQKNIRAGAEMLRRIIQNLPPNAPIEQIATLYNNINAKTVNDYGKRVKAIYDAQPWDSLLKGLDPSYRYKGTEYEEIMR